MHATRRGIACERIQAAGINDVHFRELDFRLRQRACFCFTAHERTYRWKVEEEMARAHPPERNGKTQGEQFSWQFGLAVRQPRPVDSTNLSCLARLRSIRLTTLPPTSPRRLRFSSPCRNHPRHRRSYSPFAKSCTDFRAFPLNYARVQHLSRYPR